eukprot:scaffold73616_cov42-Phaeocystis_antarctica.AAC.2
MLASVSRTARLGDQLQLDDESNSQIADRYATGSSARRGVAVGDLPTSIVSEPQLPAGPRIGVFCANAPRRSAVPSKREPHSASWSLSTSTWRNSLSGMCTSRCRERHTNLTTTPRSSGSSAGADGIGDSCCAGGSSPAASSDPSSDPSPAPSPAPSAAATTSLSATPPWSCGSRSCLPSSSFFIALVICRRLGRVLAAFLRATGREAASSSSPLMACQRGRRGRHR